MSFIKMISNFTAPSKEGANFPIIERSEVENARKVLKYTPDWPLLEQYQYVALFVYNSLMQGYRDHKLLGNTESEFRGTAFTSEVYTVYKKLLGKATFPIPLEYQKRKGQRMDDFHEYAKLKGQLFLVRPKVIKLLDEAAENGVQFIRKRGTVLVPHSRYLKLDENIHRVRTCPYVQAFIYVGSRNYWNDLLDGGYQYRLVDMYNLDNQWISNYFYFDKKEYDVR